jgi:2-oxoglutarate dehydrogenase E2 component (dihydrolipoamide succinyltransferase)
VPQLSESVSEATLLAWHKKQGEAVKRDENLIDIETDKVVLELPSPVDGVLVSILKGDKGTVTAGEVIAKIDTEAKAPAGSSKVAASAAPVGAETAEPEPAPPESAAPPPAPAAK